jgi:dephospho-CoA kinase
MGAAVLLEVGLTGGIASGKTTVDAVLERLGAHVIDADAIVHALLRDPTPERAAVIAAFGSGITTPEGAVNRRALAPLVFEDAEARSRLNAILHPGVRREEARLKDEIRAAGGGVVITDAALLVETGRYRDYDRLLVVSCDPALQLSRLLAREPGLSIVEARARLAAQAPLAAKLAVADYVIETSGSLAETESRARMTYRLLIEDLEAKRAGKPLPARPRPAEPPTDPDAGGGQPTRSGGPRRKG